MGLDISIVRTRPCVRCFLDVRGGCVGLGRYKKGLACPLCTRVMVEKQKWRFWCQNCGGIFVMNSGRGVCDAKI